MSDSPHPALQAPAPLLEAKLRPLTPRPGTVERVHVLSLLRAGAERPVVTLIAPPGYGKTTVLAQWAASEPRPVAWLTLDDQDNDPAVLVRYLVAALGRIGSLDPLLTAGSGTADRLLSHVVPRLVSGLHAWDASFVLVLDDVHRITGRASLDMITALLDHLPPGSRAALAGRMEPALPVARLRAQGALLEIGPEVLALDETEAAALTSGAGAKLDAAEVQELTARAEGWAAGIYLATLARGPETRDRPRPGLAHGADRYVAAYLWSEVEQGLGEEDVAFLTRTSILETITPEVADAVSGTTDASARLHRLAHSNLLVQDLGGAWRYHNLLRDFLAAELDRREPAAVRDLHGRAARWFAEAGDAERAIEHALAAGRMDDAARYMTEAALPTYRRGEIATVDRWVRLLDPAALQRYPPLIPIAAWVYFLTGRGDEADRMARLAEAASFDGPAAGGAASFESQRWMLRAVMMQGGPRAAVANAGLALRIEPPDSTWRSSALTSLGAAHMMLGEEDDADRAFAEAVEVTAGHPLPATLIALAGRAQIRMRRGDWTGAEPFVEACRDHLARVRFDPVIPLLGVYAVSARAAIHRGDIARGRADLVKAHLIRPLANHAIPWHSVNALVQLARAYLAMSDTGGAQVAIREAEAIIRVRPALGNLTDELLEVRGLLAGARTTLAGSSTLTTAELRVLPLLPTYLSFQEIADSLGISRNTVKTHALSIYGKLWASSRGEAVERAVELGLLEPWPILTRAPARDS